MLLLSFKYYSELDGFPKKFLYRLSFSLFSAPVLLVHFYRRKKCSFLTFIKVKQTLIESLPINRFNSINFFFSLYPLLNSNRCQCVKLGSHICGLALPYGSLRFECWRYQGGSLRTIEECNQLAKFYAQWIVPPNRIYVIPWATIHRLDAVANHNCCSSAFRDLPPNLRHFFKKGMKDSARLLR